MNQRLVEAALERGAREIDDPIARDSNGEPLKRYRLPRETRLQRVSDLLRALATIAGGAKRTTNLEDVTPKLIVLTTLRGGNHLFTQLAQADGNVARFHVDAFKETLKDYADRIQGKVYVGRRNGFMDQLHETLQSLAEQSERLEYGSVRTIIESYVRDELPQWLPE
jgi:CRISPR-associated protein Cst2